MQSIWASSTFKYYENGANNEYRVCVVQLCHCQLWYSSHQFTVTPPLLTLTVNIPRLHLLLLALHIIWPMWLQSQRVYLFTYLFIWNMVKPCEMPRPLAPEFYGWHLLFSNLPWVIGSPQFQCCHKQPDEKQNWQEQVQSTWSTVFKHAHHFSTANHRESQSQK